MVKKILKSLLPDDLLANSLPTYHLLRAVVANVLHGFPARNLNVIGITGTNGKSTTASYVINILREAGYRVGYVTSMGSGVDDRVIEDKQDDAAAPGTTRDVFVMQKLMRRMKKSNVDWVVVEVTSHALSQHRIWGIPIHTAELTNFSPDHLDYHGTVENYMAAKAELFKMARVNTVLNRDDSTFDYFAGQSAVTLWTFGKTNDSNVELVNSSQSLDGSELTISYEDTTITPEIRLIGDFNAENALAAAAVCVSVGIDSKAISSGLETVKNFPGRMEILPTRSGFRVLIDYAHDPEAFKRVFATVRKLTNGRLIAVFGGHVQHDFRGLGREAGKMADVLIVADDEPENDDPEEIRREIIRSAKATIPEGKETQVYDIADRREAIMKAISIAEPQDVVMLLCLGHQKYRRIGDKHVPWSDKEEAVKALQAKGLLLGKT